MIRSVPDGLVRAERPGLLQEAVDERGLAMVDVRDDRDVAESGHGTCFRNAGPGGGRFAGLIRISEKTEDFFEGGEAEARYADGST